MALGRPAVPGALRAEREYGPVGAATAHLRYGDARPQRLGVLICRLRARSMYCKNSPFVRWAFQYGVENGVMVDGHVNRHEKIRQPCQHPL